MERGSARARLGYGMRWALVAAVWALVTTGPWESRVEERLEQPESAGASLMQTDIALRYQVALRALKVNTPVPGGQDELKRMLDDREAEGAPARDVALRRACVALLAADPPGDEQRSEAAEALRRGAERDESATDLGGLAEALQPGSHGAAVDRAVSQARRIRPPWLGLFLASSIADAGAEGGQAREALRTRSVGFLVLLAAVLGFMFAAGLAGLALLPGHLVLLQTSRRVAAMLGTAPAIPAPAEGLPVFSDTVPDVIPPTAEAQPRPERARWGLIDAIEALTVLVAGQVGFGLAARVALEPFGMGPQDVGPTALAFALSGALTVAYCHWRARRSGPGYERALGTVAKSPWSTIGWGLGGYCAMVPLLFLAGLLVSRITGGETYSVNPAIEMTLEITNPLEIVAMFLIVVVGAPLVEETLFRGLLYGALRARVGATVAILLTGVGFGAMHLDPMVGPQLAIIGLTLAYVRERTGSLYPCVLLHALQNGLSFGLMVAMKL